MLVYIDDREDEELDGNYGYDYGEEDSECDNSYEIQPNDEESEASCFT